MNNGRHLKRVKRAVCAVIAVMTASVIALGLAAPESVKAISAFNINQSATFVLLRLGLYTALYVKWKPIVLSFNPDVSEYRIAKSRQSILSIMVIYEVFVGFNIFKLMGV